MDGRLVLEKTLNSNSELSLDVSSLSNGAYIINLTNGNQLNQSKMILISK